MVKIIIDTTNAPDSGQFQAYDGPIPPNGLYKALFKKGWWVKSSTGKPMLKVLFVLESTKESVVQYNGCPAFHNITNEASTAWKMKELFTALGTGAKSAVDTDDKGNVTRIGSARPGKTYLLINSVVERYKGQERMGIKNLAPLPGTVTTEDIDASESATAYEDSLLPESSDDVFGDDAWNSGDDPWADGDSHVTGGDPPF
jgi:hypothetical protein